MHWKNGHFLQHLVEASTKEEDEIKIVNLNKVTIEININKADIFFKTPRGNVNRRGRRE